MDLLYAASAANDAAALCAIADAQGSRTEELYDGEEELETVNDLEVAACAAAAADWNSCEEQPVRFPVPRPRHPCEMDLDTDGDTTEDDCVDCPAKMDSETFRNDQSEADRELVKVILEFMEGRDGYTGGDCIQLRFEYQHPRSSSDALMDIDVPSLKGQTQSEFRSYEACHTENTEVDEVTLTAADGLSILGEIQSMIGSQLVVQAEPLVRLLDVESLLFTLEGKTVGKVVDIFGSVERPLYLVNGKTATDDVKGVKVYSTPRFAVDVNLSTEKQDVDASDSDRNSVDEDQNETSQQFSQCQTTFNVVRPRLSTSQSLLQSRTDLSKKRQRRKGFRKQQHQSLPQTPVQWLPQPAPSLGPGYILTNQPPSSVIFQQPPAMQMMVIPSQMPTMPYSLQANRPFAPLPQFVSFEASIESSVESPPFQPIVPFPGFHPYNALMAPSQNQLPSQSAPFDAQEK